MRRPGVSGTRGCTACVAGCSEAACLLHAVVTRGVSRCSSPAWRRQVGKSTSKQRGVGTSGAGLTDRGARMLAAWFLSRWIMV